MKWSGLAAAMALGLGAAVAANATTVDFSYENLGAPVATGSFSYATGDTGVLGYTDLSSFQVTIAGVTYNLAQADALPNYNYFAYDTFAGAFVENPKSFDETLGAIANNFTSGFFFDDNVLAEEYSTGTLVRFDSINYTVSGAVPEPANWALMIAGIGGIGLMFRRGRKIAGDGLRNARTA